MLAIIGGSAIRRSAPASSGGSVASIVSSSRDVGSTAGGAALTLTVTGASGLPTVTIGGTAATSVVVVNPTTITCVAPAHATGVVDIVAGGQTLTGGFEYLPAPTTTFVQDAFESSSLAGWIDQGGTNVSIQTTPVPTGYTKCAQVLTSSSISYAAISHQLPNNAALITNNPNGVYARVKIAVDQTAFDNTWVLGSDQTKLHLARYFDNGSGQPGWLMMGIGLAFSGPAPGKYHLGVARDFNIEFLTPASASDPAGAMPIDVYTELQIWMSRDANTSLGTIRMWVNGKSTAPAQSHANFGKNADTAIDKLYIEWGNAFNQYASVGTGHISMVAASIANGYIEGS